MMALPGCSDPSVIKQFTIVNSHEEQCVYIFYITIAKGLRAMFGHLTAAFFRNIDDEDTYF